RVSHHVRGRHRRRPGVGRGLDLRRRLRGAGAEPALRLPVVRAGDVRPDHHGGGYLRAPPPRPPPEEDAALLPALAPPMRWPAIGAAGLPLPPAGGGGGLGGWTGVPN